MYPLSLSPAQRAGRTFVSWRSCIVLPIAVLAASLTVGCAVPVSMAAPMEALPTPSASATTPILLPTDPAKLTSSLAAVSKKKIDRVAVHVTTLDGTVLTNTEGNTPLTPASTMKLLTSAVALDTLGADHRFVTRTVQADPTTVVLVGGGDPLLTDKASTSTYKRASLQALAKATATAVKVSGRSRVSVGYDATLFAGPSFNPSWKKSWKGYEARVSALEIGSGKAGWRAQGDPARTAAMAFAARLKKYGVTVSSVAAKKAPAQAAELARVSSASLAMIIKRTLLISDNVAAETLSRQAALRSGKEGSFAGATANVKAWLTTKGLWADGLKLLDGSGLAPGSKLTAASLTAVVRFVLADPAYAPVIAGLPVAGGTGTLAKRFDDPSEKAGRRNVHAKTGTLRGVAGLAGFLTTAEGERLVFAELANTAKSVSSTRLYNWLDRTAAATITCACP